MSGAHPPGSQYLGEIRQVTGRHGKSRRVPLAPADLTALTLIDSKLNPVQWADWCALNGLELPVRAGPSFERGSLAIAAAVDGLGVALETRRFAEVNWPKATWW